MELVNYDIAVLLKNKGFNLPTKNYSDSHFKDEWYSEISFDHNKNVNEISRPYQASVVKWIRDSLNKNIEISVLPSDRIEFVVKIVNIYPYEVVYEGNTFETYDKALISAIEITLNE